MVLVTFLFFAGLYIVLSIAFITCIAVKFTTKPYYTALAVIFVVILPIWDIVLGAIVYFPSSLIIPKFSVEKTVEVNGFSYNGQYDSIVKEAASEGNTYKVDGLHFSFIKTGYLYIESRIKRKCVNDSLCSRIKRSEPPIYRCVPLAPRRSNPTYVPTYCCPADEMKSEYTVRVRQISLGTSNIGFKKIVERSTGKTIATFNAVGFFVPFPFFHWVGWQWWTNSIFGLSRPVGNWHSFEFDVLKPKKIKDEQGPDYYDKAAQYCGVTTERSMKMEADLLILNRLQPPRELANGTEVIVVTGYEADQRNTSSKGVKVVLNRPGRNVLLILNSYRPVAWQIEAGPSTRIAGVLVSPYSQSTVRSNIPTRAYTRNLSTAYQLESPGFVGLLRDLNMLFGIEKVDASRGAHSLPSVITVSRPDPPGPSLTLAGPPVQRPRIDFEFSLYTRDHGAVKWTLEGQAEDSSGSTFLGSKIAVSPSGDIVYLLKDDKLFVLDRKNGEKREIPIPANFPELSWASDVAYDTKRNVLSVISLGGEGYLCRFDTRTNRWIDFRSMKNVDAVTLAYDPGSDRYLAWTRDARLLFLSNEGQPVSERKLTGILPGYKRWFADRDYSHIVRIVPNKGAVALVAFERGSVRWIWHYNINSNEARLTYRN